MMNSGDGVVPRGELLVEALKIAVIGGGTMGAGIAQVAAVSGFQTTLCELNDELVAAAKARVNASLDKAVARGKSSAADAAEARGRLSFRTDRAAVLADADVVVEAVPEIIELKKQIFQELDAEAPKARLLASNTSSLSVTEIAAATTRPERVLGLHFFNPPPVMKLVEIIRSDQCSVEALGLAEELVTAFGKTGVTVLDAPGFATSRLGLVLGLEAMRMVEQGVAAAGDIDSAMELGYRHPMGPLKTTDYVGLDVRLAIAEHLWKEVGESFRPPTILRRLVRAGKLGRKSGEGFYRWDETGKCLGPSAL